MMNSSGGQLRNSQETTRETRISRYITLGVILVEIAIVGVVGLPAAALVEYLLDQQAVSQVQRGQSTTQRLYEAEGQRLEELAALIAMDPTLGKLIQGGDYPGLTAYLDELQESMSVDALIVVTADGQTLGQPPDWNLSFTELIASHEMPFNDFLVLNNSGEVIYVAAQDLNLGRETQPLAEGWAFTAVELDDDFLQAMAQQTGMVHSVITNEARVSSSLAPTPDWPVKMGLTVPGQDPESICCTSGVASQETFEIGYLPLADSQGNILAYDETAIPSSGIRAKTIQVIILLFTAGLILILGASTSVILLSRRVTDPLKQLVADANRLRDGDLNTPISSKGGLLEINQLAIGLDRARRQLRNTHLATQREQKRIEHLLGAIREGVVAIDEDGLVTFFSADAERILGYKAGRVLQAPYTEIFRTLPGDISTIDDMLQHPEGALPFQHLTVLDANDNPMELAVSFSWLENETTNGLRKERVLVLRDVSEEEALERLRCDFLANVAHEFRTPLSAVIATTELLATENHSLTSEELGELANMIRMSTMGLQALIDNLLESATIEAGCFRVHPRPTQLQDVIHSAVETMTPLLQRRNQALEIEIQDDLPILWADPARLSQSLINLLANASSFGPMGSPIALTVQQDDDMLTLAVLDSGPGLPTGRISDLFLRFVTGDQPRSGQYGIGLGLSVTKAIVEAHGGHVGAENRDEGGAKVWFTLPLHPQERT